MTKQNRGKILVTLRVYLILTIFGGIITLLTLSEIPSEAKNVAILGLSWERLLLIAGVLVVILATSGVLIISWVRKPIYIRYQQRLTTKIQDKNTYGLSILLCSLILFGSIYLLLLTPEIIEPFTRAYFIRIQPLISWGVALCIQTLIVLPLLHHGFNLQNLNPPSRTAYQIAGLFGLLLILWIFISQTQLGLTATDKGAGWYVLGTPLLETQAVAAWVLGMLYILFGIWAEKNPSIFHRSRGLRLLRIDLITSIGLWVAAFVMWNCIPLTPNWFAAPPRSPNQAIYPNSDAYLYDTTGQTLLTGEGFKTQNSPFAIRPLLALFLAGFHALQGVDYEPMIWMQVAVLAFIPVLLYWITLQLHNRVSALVAATLLIFRETNAIILASSITTSNSKLLMADLPTTLGVMLLILVFIRWLQRPIQRQYLTLIAGGVTGAFMLIRPEFAILLPFLGLIALFDIIQGRKKIQQQNQSKRISSQSAGLRIWFKGILFIAFGTILFLLPWIWRNYQLTGTIFLDSPHYRSDLIALRYKDYTNGNNTETIPATETSEPTSDTTIPATETATKPTENVTATPNTKIAYEPDENAEAFSKRMFNNALNYAKNNLPAVLHFVTNHFFNSQLQTVLYLPASYRLPDSVVGFLGHKDTTLFWEQCCSAEGYIRRLPFWFKWDGSLPQQSILPLAVNLFLIAVGIVSSWNRCRFMSLLPLAASIGYTLINALVRNSGGRYILPIDWVGIFFFSIGLSQLTLWIWTYLRGSDLPSAITGSKQPRYSLRTDLISRKRFFTLSAAILLCGAVLPLSEIIIPKQIPEELQHERQTQFEYSFEFPLEAFLAEGGSIVHGRALYPRYHAANQGEAGDRTTPFTPLPFSRLDFYMVGPFNGGIVLAQDREPSQFENGTDTMAIGCPKKKYFDALFVVTYNQNDNESNIFIRQPFPTTITCPIPEP